MRSEPSTRPPADRIWLACLLLGVLLRLAWFVPERSLWLDEALLASNIAERSLPALLEPLEGDQAAPPGYLALTKASVQLFGLHERSLRAPSLLASLAALIVFATWARRRLERTPARLAVALFASLPALVLYAAELKPYAFDLLAAVLVTCLAADLVASPRRGRLLALALVGVLAPWFSFASVFVLAGAGLVLAVHGVRSRSIAPPVLLGVAAAWTASFLAMWIGFASASAANENFARYWESSFLPLPPTAARDLGLLARAVFRFVEAPFETRHALPTADFAPFAAGLVLCLLGLGVLKRAREDRVALAVWVLPWLVAVLASASGHYPFVGRFLLVFAPSIVWLLVVGWHSTSTGRSWSAAILLGLALLGTSQLFLRPVPAVQTRQALTELAEQMQPGDTLLVHSRSLASFLYYSEHDPRCALPPHQRIDGAMAGEGIAGLLRGASQLEADGRVWFLYEEDWAQVHPTGLLGAALEERAPRVETMFFEGTQLHRFAFDAQD